MSVRSCQPWLFVLALATAACAHPTDRGAAPVLTLGMEGRSNATPALAARGMQVVLAWTASNADGSQGNAYVAASTDGGRSFGPPVRVNDIPGIVRNSGEQAPRLALGDRTLAVVWAQKRNGESEVVYARSTDGGRSFSPSQRVHDDAPGIRGWAAAALDSADHLHVVWLDGRHAAPMSTGAAGSHAGHQMGTSGTSPRQDVYRAVIAPDGTRRETLVAASVCFCCKTAVVPRTDGSLFFAWRHIFPESTRDIAAAVLPPNGDHVAQIARVSEDHWQLNACPDDGPSAAADPSGAIHIAWPTFVDGQKAIFYATSSDGAAFGPRERVTPERSDGSHPQIVLVDGRQAVVTWDRTSEDGRQVEMRARDLRSGRWGAVSTLTANTSGKYPVATLSDGAIVMAWTSDTQGGSTIATTRVAAP